MGGSESSSLDSSPLACSLPATPHGLVLPSRSLCTPIVQGDRQHSLGVWLSRTRMALLSCSSPSPSPELHSCPQLTAHLLLFEERWRSRPWGKLYTEAGTSGRTHEASECWLGGKCGKVQPRMVPPGVTLSWSSLAAQAGQPPAPAQCSVLLIS